MVLDQADASGLLGMVYDFQSAYAICYQCQINNGSTISVVRRPMIVANHSWERASTQQIMMHVAIIEGGPEDLCTTEEQTIRLLYSISNYQSL